MRLLPVEVDLDDNLVTVAIAKQVIDDLQDILLDPVNRRNAVEKVESELVLVPQAGCYL